MAKDNGATSNRGAIRFYDDCLGRPGEGIVSIEVDTSTWLNNGIIVMNCGNSTATLVIFFDSYFVIFGKAKTRDFRTAG
jgi:hypothetical protein